MTEDWKLIFEDYQKAAERLTEVLQQSYSILIRDASIKRFEIAFELAWKALKSFLADQGLVCNSPISCLKEAFRFGLIKDDKLWIDMTKDRNSAVHTYSEKFADALYEKLKDYHKLLEGLLNSLKEFYE